MPNHILVEDPKRRHLSVKLDNHILFKQVGDHGKDANEVKKIMKNKVIDQGDYEWGTWGRAKTNLNIALSTVDGVGVALHHGPLADPDDPDWVWMQAVYTDIHDIAHEGERSAQANRLRGIEDIILYARTPKKLLFDYKTLDDATTSSKIATLLYQNRLPPLARLAILEKAKHFNDTTGNRIGVLGWHEGMEEELRHRRKSLGKNTFYSYPKLSEGDIVDFNLLGIYQFGGIINQ